MLIYQKIIALMMLTLLFVPLGGNPTPALSCYNYQGKEICLVSIKRSAKYYWEYRVITKIEGMTFPPIIYNCRNQVKTLPNGLSQPFEPKGVGNFICNKFSK